MPLRDIIFATVFFAALPVCFFRPFWGILMWTIVSLLNPHAFMWSLRYDFPWALAVALATLGGYVIFAFDWQRLVSWENGLILALWIWFTITSVVDTRMPVFMHFSADTWFRWRFVSKILLMTIVTTSIVNSWERLRWLVLTICASLAVLVWKALPFMILTGGSFRLYGPAGSMLADNNDLGLALNMTLPMFFFMAQSESNPKLKRLLMITFLISIPAVLFTYSRGALVGLAFLLLMFVWSSPRRLLIMPVLLLTCLFALFLTPAKWQKRMDFRRKGALVDQSALSRINAWTYCWRLASNYPLTGGGFEAFTPELFQRYAPNPADVHGPHSIYFGVLAEHGFAGLLLYLSLLVSSLVTLGRVRRAARRWGEEVVVKYASMLNLSFMGFMITGAFLGRAYFDYYFTLVACTIVLRRLWQEEVAAAETAGQEVQYA
jgi:probable O-glycosylation ligase (exosortase A-associated)